MKDWQTLEEMEKEAMCQRGRGTWMQEAMSDNEEVTNETWGNVINKERWVSNEDWINSERQVIFYVYSFFMLERHQLWVKKIYKKIQIE